MNNTNPWAFVYIIYTCCSRSRSTPTGARSRHNRLLEAWQPRSVGAGFDGEFLPAEQPPLESAVAEWRSVRGKHDDSERFGN